MYAGPLCLAGQFVVVLWAGQKKIAKSLVNHVLLRRRSATSEELAAQAEQLQASIAFFRIETNQGTAPPAPKPAAAAPHAAHLAHKPIVVAHAQAKDEHAAAARPKARRAGVGPKPNGHAATASAWNSRRRPRTPMTGISCATEGSRPWACMTTPASS